jgi:hypothetical protein
MSIMNMPPLPYLARIPGIDAAKCADAFTDPTVWASFDPKLVTLCSPDPQAFRPPEEPMNVLQDAPADQFQGRALRFRRAHADPSRPGGRYRGPRALTGWSSRKAQGARFDLRALAKWAMLLAGNYRCVRADTVISHPGSRAR